MAVAGGLVITSMPLVALAATASKYSIVDRKGKHMAAVVAGQPVITELLVMRLVAPVLRVHQFRVRRANMVAHLVVEAVVRAIHHLAKGAAVPVFMAKARQGRLQGWAALAAQTQVALMAAHPAAGAGAAQVAEHQEVLAL